MLELHSDDPARFTRAEEALSDAIDIGTAPTAAPLVLDRIRAN